MTTPKWFENIVQAVYAQKEDNSLWTEWETIGEQYLWQSLQWLHKVILENDQDALAAILEQARKQTNN